MYINVVCCVGRVEIQIEILKGHKVGVLPIRIVKSNVSSVGLSLRRRANARNVRLYYS